MLWHNGLRLVGVPPLSGFVAKLKLVQAAVAEHQYAAVAAVAVVSLLTLVSMLKLWNAIFTQPEPQPESQPVTRPGAGPSTEATIMVVPSRSGPILPPADAIASRPLLLAPAVVLAGVAVSLGLAAEPLRVVCERAAAGRVDVGTYVEAVTSP